MLFTYKSALQAIIHYLISTPMYSGRQCPCCGITCAHPIWELYTCIKPTNNTDLM